MPDNVAVGQETFSPGWYYQPELKPFFVLDAKMVGTKAHFDHRRKASSLVVYISPTHTSACPLIRFNQLISPAYIVFLSWLLTYQLASSNKLN